MGHQPDVFVGLIVAGGNAGIAHQRTDIADGAVHLGICLQPGYQLADEVAPAHAQAMGADPPQQVYGSLGKQLIGSVVVLSVFHQDAAADGTGQPQAVQQAGCLGSRFMNGDFHDPQFPGLGEHAAYQRAGYAQLSGNIALFLIFQVIAPGNIRQLFLLVLTDSHKKAPYI